MEKWLWVSPSREKITGLTSGLSVLSLFVFPVRVWVFSRYYCFFPETSTWSESKTYNLGIGLGGHCKMTIGMHESQNCLSFHVTLQ